MKIFVLITQTILYCILLISVIMLVTSKSALLPIRSFIVLSGSMEPVIPMGSAVFTRATNTYQLGDVVTFQSGDIFITHRIVIDQDNRYQTKGDANKDVDIPSVQQKNMAGKVLFHIPYIGKFSLILKTFFGFFFLVIVPAFLFMAFEFYNMYKEIAKTIKKKYEVQVNTDRSI